MLIEFRFKNYRSFRDKAVLSMEAIGLNSLKNSLIQYNNMKLLPGIAIYGKNGGGKSNVIRAFWLGFNLSEIRRECSMKSLLFRSYRLCLMIIL